MSFLKAQKDTSRKFNTAKHSNSSHQCWGRAIQEICAYLIDGQETTFYTLVASLMLLLHNRLINRRQVLLQFKNKYRSN